MKLVAPATTVRFYGPGERCEDAVPGDVVFVRHPGIVAAGIRFFERLRRPRGLTRGQWRAFCWTNHMAVVLTGGPKATIAQETAAGCVVSPLSSFVLLTYAVAQVSCTAEQRAAGVLFSLESLQHGYGFLQIPADAVNAATGLELSLGVGDRMVCSTMATRALERMGLIPDRNPGAVTPAHGAWYLGAARG